MISRSEKEMKELLYEGNCFVNRATIKKRFNLRELQFLLKETKKRKLRKWHAWIVNIINEKTGS